MTEQSGFRYDPPDVEQIVLLERKWIQARTLLDNLMKDVVHDMPVLAAGTGLSDASILFEFTLTWIKHQHATSPIAPLVTDVLLAAAMTRLAHIETGQHNDMATFEKDVTKK